MFKVCSLSLVWMLLFAGCASEMKSYNATERSQKAIEPTKVYIEDQVFTLNSRGELSPDKYYVEVTTKDGTTMRGKLMEISDKDIHIATGFTHKTVAEKIKRQEIEVAVAKSDVLILTVW